MMELYKNSCDLNFNFVNESFEPKKKCEEDTKCVIIFSDSYETGSELDTTSYKQRNQANARERYRTHRYWFSEKFLPSHQQCRRFYDESCLICQSSLFSVNSAFSTLRLLIPTEPKNRKLSKIETLRLAKSYISHLSASLAVGKFQSALWSFQGIIRNDLLFDLFSGLLTKGNSSARQPCFEASKNNLGKTLVDYRSNICTFCVSSVIHQKRIN